ncbi:ATP-binding protein [Microbispora amethystogenes]|uniref:ATP-binding protein n=1 Tax=Microbispora amethystogenes TaxID=1427754 RepID=UPI003405AFAD
MATARAFIRDVLGDGHPVVDTAMLLGSELVSNAVRHSRSGHRAGGRLTVVVAVKPGDLVHVDVIDEGSESGIPEIPAQVDGLHECGRGLWLVRELSSAWGWRDYVTGRVVWFVVSP